MNVAGGGRAKFSPGIATKLAVCFVVSAALILAGLGALNLRLQRKHSEELILVSAERLSDIVVRGTRHEMLRNDREALYHTIGEAGREPGMRRIRIFNKEGRISFSTDTSEVGKVVDKQAEACYGCHAQGVPLERLNRPDSSRVFRDEGNGRVLAMIRPIRNDETCSSAACHEHPAQQKVLGVIDVQFSLDTVDRQTAALQNWTIWGSLGALVLLCGISLLFVYTVLHRPIHALTDGIREVAAGDLTHQIEPVSNDELGEVALAFNKMTGELSEAHAEITSWAQTLEQRVQSKTEELERAHKYLVSSEKLAGIGKLAATVAHEVNNPLFGILTYARLCLKDLEKTEISDDSRRRMLGNIGIIERESRRCGDIIRNLLTYARQAPRKRERNDVNQIVDRSVTLIRHQLNLQGVALEVQASDTLPEIICDAGQVQQVVLVLLTNASEATGEGGHLSIRTEPWETDGVKIVVRDDGPGISPQNLAQIFEPFFTTKEEKLRTGLGLAVAKSIVETHGGQIGVTSEPGQGAEFCVMLPREAPESRETRSALEIAAAASPGETR
ncbi:MAG: ATP-binding protein [Bryobacteraceae bacterium]|nr:ATP-binding protein [Bryobacteraceae bacterium]